MLSNNALLKVQGSLLLTWSDHHAVMFHIELPSQSQIHNAPRPHKVRAWNKINQEQFERTPTGSQPVYSEDLDHTVSTYTNWLHSATLALAPEKSVCSKRRSPTAP
ncbi:hypothetical protein NDU88_007391 [Pleurodeles waltl]|uniref:Uncharacterized protein n=1 Tax=Pleurodeles waltl TaxID=8319 RepID=A0AAV7QMV8_PLEWA|nr:hypothetical protein NDU88_007391 [Pleurodeles waltl]